MSKVGEINFIITADNSKYRRKMSETLNDSKRLFEDLKNLQKNYQGEMLSSIENIKNKQKGIFKDLEESGSKATSSVSDNMKNLSNNFKEVINNTDNLKKSLTDVKDIKTPKIEESVSLTPLNMAGLSNIFKPIVDQSGLGEIDSVFHRLKKQTLDLSGDISSAITDNIKTIGLGQEAAITKLGTSMIGQIGKIATASFAILTGLGVKAALKYDKMIAEMVKKTGWARDQIAEMESGLSEAIKLGFDSKDIADVFSGVSINLKLEGDPLEDMSMKFLKLADIANESAASLESAGSRAMKGWEVPKDEWDEFLDYIMKAKKATGIDATTLLTDVSKYSDPLSVLGYDWKEAMTILGSLYKAGANSDSIMSGMRLASSTLSDIGFSDMRVGMDLVIEDIKTSNMSDAVDKAGAIFGRRVAADMARAIQRGDFDLDDLMAEIEESVAGIDEIWEDSLTLGDKFKLLFAELQESARPLGEVILDTLHSLMPVFESLVEVITSVLEAFQKLPEPIQQALVYMGLFKVATKSNFGSIIGTIVGFISKFGGHIASVFGMLSSAGVSFTGIISGAVTFLTGPVGLAIAAIAALGFAAYKLITDYEGTILFFKKWGSTVPAIFFMVVESILHSLNLIPSAWNKIMDVMGSDKLKITVMDDLIKQVQDQRDKYIDNFKDKGKELKEHKKKKKEDKQKKKEDKKDTGGINIDTIPKTQSSSQDDLNKLEGFYKSKTTRGKEESKLEKELAKDKLKKEKELEKLKKENEKKRKQEQQKLKKAEEERLKAEEALEKKILDNIKKKNAFLDKTLDKHKEIVNSLKGYVGLFDKITNKQLKATNPYKLMKQAEMREKAYRQREESLSILANRGVPRELLEEFMKMGVGDLGNITGLAKLNDQQLKAWLSTQSNINKRINDEASDRVITQVRMGDIIIQTSTDDPRAYKQEVEEEIYKTFKSKGVELLSF